MFVYKADLSIALTTLQSSSMIVHVFTQEQNKKIYLERKKSRAGLEPQNPSLK